MYQGTRHLLQHSRRCGCLADRLHDASSKGERGLLDARLILCIVLVGLARGVLVLHAALAFCQQGANKVVTLKGVVDLCVGWVWLGWVVCVSVVVAFAVSLRRW